MKRRRLLQAAAGATPLYLMAGAGLTSRRLLAEWPADAFHAEQLAEAERLLFGERPITESEAVLIEAPNIAENGRNVPVEVRITLPNTTAVSLFSDANPVPLLARVHFTPAVAPRISIRVKLGGSGNLLAVAEASGSLYRATRAVKVTAGGCGG